MVKIRLLNDGGYRGFVNAQFPMIVELSEDDYESSFNGIDIKISALEHYCREAGEETDDYAGDTSDSSLYFSRHSDEYEFIHE